MQGVHKRENCGEWSGGELEKVNAICSIFLKLKTALYISMSIKKKGK